MTEGDAARSGSVCPSCGARLSAPTAPCDECPSEFSSDPTWPEPVESSPGVTSAAITRLDKLRRLISALTFRVQRAGPTLAITAEVRRHRSAFIELPVEVGVTLLERSGRFDGIPDTFIRIEQVAEPVMCSVPARGLHAGDPAVLVLTQGDLNEEIQTLVH